jgi:transcriptional regulator with GAF, ATPase, and Fis domain
MLNHQWPGNVRELRNCITRTLAFAESDLLLAEHVLFADWSAEQEQSDDALDGHEASIAALPPPPQRESLPAPPEKRVFNKGGTGGSDGPEDQAELNARQRKAWKTIARNGEITRSEYQMAVGGNISVRTAQYDLHDMVNKGLLKKSGRGPSSRYLLTQSYVI